MKTSLMSGKGLPRFSRTPGAAIRSAVLSVRHAGIRGLSQMPIVSSAEASVRVGAGASLALGGRLFVGYWPEEDGDDDGAPGPSRQQRSILRIAPRGRLATGGWVILGPGVQTVIGPGAELRIGEETYVTGNAQIVCADRIQIGRACAISYGVTILD